MSEMPLREVQMLEIGFGFVGVAELMKTGDVLCRSWRGLSARRKTMPRGFFFRGHCVSTTSSSPPS